MIISEGITSDRVRCNKAGFVTNVVPGAGRKRVDKKGCVKIRIMCQAQEIENRIEGKYSDYSHIC